MECSSCGGSNPDDNKYCGDCGAALILRCSICGSESPAGKRFCGECGAALGATRSPSQSEQSPAKRRAADADAERRQLTVMFCDLVGSTALSARLDPEDFRAVIAAYNDCIAQVITRFDGLIARYSGDGVLAYFGYPRAHEDDAEQATRAGLALVEAVGKLRTDGTAALAIRVGIATGTVIAGDLIGEGAAQERAVFGEAPNFAARLQAFAEPGMVVICANTQRLAAGHFEYRDLGVVTLKGLAEPMRVWQVLRASQVESRFEARQNAKFQRPLGRDEELELLMRRWRKAEQGEGQVVVLTGEPGIGKSHVTAALQEMVQAEPHGRLRYFCSPHHTNSVLYPVVAQLERAAGFERGDQPAERLHKLKRVLVDASGNSESLFFLAHLLAVPLDQEQRQPALTPQQRKERTLATVLAQSEAMAARHPLLVIFEDVHWIDPTSLELLTLAVERAARLRMMFIITARPEFTAPWPGYAHVSTIRLSRLSRRDGTALVHRIAGRGSLPRDVVVEILARTDGVPLFIEELTKAVLESGLLQRRGGQYVLDRPLPTGAIPSTLHASLLARLDRLEAAKEVAQTGAAIGREFLYELLGLVAGLPREKLDEALEQLIRSELLYCRGQKPHAVYTFKHALVRDAAYTGLLKGKRVQLHAAIANALEQSFPDIVEAQPETLAWHLTEAGIDKKGAEYWLKAGRMAGLRSANTEAIAHLQRGLEAVGRLPAGSERNRLELDLELALGPCLIATQGPASKTAVATFSRARELCERLGDPPEYLHVMFWLATAAVVRGELLRANDTVIDLVEAAKAHGNRPALLNARRGHGMILLFLGRLVEAIEETRAAIELFEACDETERLAARAAGQDAGAAALALLSWALWLHGDADEAVSRINAALARADDVQHPHTHAYVRYYASVLHALRGEIPTALAHAEHCFALSEEHGFRQWYGLSRAMRGVCIGTEKPDSGALDDVATAVNDYCKVGYQLGITSLLVLTCPAFLARGQAPTALDVIEQGFAIVELNEERIFEAELYRLKARALLAAGGSDAPGQAQSLLDRAVDIATTQGARALALRATADLATLHVDQGRSDQATEPLAPIRASFAEGLNTHDLQPAESQLDRKQ